MDLFGELLDPIIKSPAFQAASLALGVIMFASAVALVFWLFRDARRRGSLSFLWGLVGVAAIVVGVFVGFAQNAWGFISVGAASLVCVMVALVAYTLLRPAEFAADAAERDLSQRLLEAELETHACPSCGSGIEVDFLICPSCNVTLRRPCDYCTRPIKTTWTTCPYCLSHKNQNDTRADAGTSGSPAKAGRRSSGKSSGANPANPSARKRSTSASPDHPPAVADDLDDLDLDFDSAPATRSRKADRGGRSSSGRSSGGSGRSSSSGRSRTSTGSKPSAGTTGTSTFKD